MYVVWLLSYAIKKKDEIETYTLIHFQIHVKFLFPWLDMQVLS
jgi:hypothetical protein